jgi:pteridine reductase
MPLAVVTGASSPIGRAIAQSLAHRGYDLILHVHRSTETLFDGKYNIVRADLSTADGQDKFCDEVKARTLSLDVLVHNASSYEESTLRTLGRETWRETMALNAEAPLFITKNLLPLLEAAPAPCVVNVTDSMAHRTRTNRLAYMASKVLLTHLTTALAVEIAPHVRVNAVAPGAVTIHDPSILSKIPLARFATADDIASAVIYLACDATYATGEILMIDGGRQLV